MQYHNEPGNPASGRWYLPWDQRWASEDPIFPFTGSNPDEYCGNDPTNFIDPSGLNRWDTLEAGHNFITVEVWDAAGKNVVGYAQLHFNISGHHVKFKTPPGICAAYHGYKSTATQDQNLLNKYLQLEKDSEGMPAWAVFCQYFQGLSCYGDVMSNVRYGGLDSQGNVITTEPAGWLPPDASPLAPGTDVWPPK
jgi:hypothetical protein